MRLLVDIGGTNARFAIPETDGSFDTWCVLKVADFRDFDDCLAAALGNLPGAIPRQEISEVAVAAAGPVRNGRVKLTNAPWTVSQQATRRVLPGVRVAILNDLAAVALALPHLGDRDIETLAPGRPSDENSLPMLAINVGTGFGAALAVRNRGSWLAVATEPGHMTLWPADAREAEAIGNAVTVEDAISGPGLAGMRQRMANADAADVRTVFARLLARVMGDLVLATGAWGGIYLCGGVLSDLDETLDRAVLVEAFGDRGGLAKRLADVPMHAILLPTPAFVGLAEVSFD